jgi:hypothetical protein
MTIAIACAITVAILVYIIGVRRQDLPEPEPVSPFQHLDERKAAIYENLRDLQFEYRLGKLSETDYQQVKAGLQKELAGVLAEVDKIKAQLAQGAPARGAAEVRRVEHQPKIEREPRPAATVAAAETISCPHCSARFDRDMKYCGECGKPMGVTV